MVMLLFLFQDAIVKSVAAAKSDSIGKHASSTVADSSSDDSDSDFEDGKVSRLVQFTLLLSSATSCSSVMN